MTKIELDESTNNIKLCGELSFDNAVEISKQGHSLINNLKNIKIDLQQVIACDSSSLVIIIDWIRYAKQHQKEIYFINIPQFILDLARISSLDNLIPIIG